MILGRIGIYCTRLVVCRIHLILILMNSRRFWRRYSSYDIEHVFILMIDVKLCWQRRTSAPYTPSPVADQDVYDSVTTPEWKSTRGSNVS